MTTITVSLPENLVASFMRWLAKWKGCEGMNLAAAAALSVRQLTPAGPEDSRWHRALDSRRMGPLSCRELLSRVALWRRTKPCSEVAITLYDDVALRVHRHAAWLGITVEEYCTKCVAYHASLDGGRYFEESAFVRFERALAAEFREEKAQRAAKALSAIESGLTLADFEPRIDVAA